jgi:hypothetical protein
MKTGDVLEYNEYTNTAGSFVPNTPSKIGLYPKYIPELYYDTTYTIPTWVILGHDGSKTIAYDDIRTEILLEFEKRIYNNIKLDGNPVPLTAENVVPGFLIAYSFASPIVAFSTNPKSGSIYPTRISSFVGGPNKLKVIFKILYSCFLYKS